MLKTIRDDRGVLNVVEFKNLPFVPKRMFYISDVPEDKRRGAHAHKECIQYIFCVTGMIDILIEDESGETSHPIENGDYFVVPALTWARVEYGTPESSIIVLCSHEYDESDYIRDFNEFKKLTEH